MKTTPPTRLFTAPVIRLVGMATCGSLLLSSCAEMGENPAMAGAMGAVIGGTAGNLIGQNSGSRHGRVVGTLVGAGVGAAIGIAIANHYKASAEQQRIASQKVSSRARERAKAKGCRYVAVAVPPKKGSRDKTKHLVKVDTETGKADDDVYVPDSAASANNGDVIKLGGQKTYLNDSLSSGI